MLAVQKSLCLQSVHCKYNGLLCMLSEAAVQKLCLMILDGAVFLWRSTLRSAFLFSSSLADPRPHITWRGWPCTRNERPACCEMSYRHGITKWTNVYRPVQFLLERFVHAPMLLNWAIDCLPHGAWIRQLAATWEDSRDELGLKLGKQERDDIGLQG